jgi:flagellar basal body rod protein FlgG
MDIINFVKSKLPKHTPSAKLLDPSNRAFLLFLTFIGVIVVGWIGYASFQPSSDDMVQKISTTGVSLEKSKVTNQSTVTDEYAADIRTINKISYDKSKEKLEGSTLPTLYNSPNNTEDVIKACGCSLDAAAKEALIKEILARGLGEIGNSDAMRVGMSDIYIRPSSLIVDDLNKPYLYNKKQISTDDTGAIIFTKDGSPVLSLNDSPTHLSNNGVLFDKTTSKLSMAGKLLSSSGVILLGEGFKASRPRMMTQIGASDTYLTNELQLATMDGKPVMHSGNFVFKGDGERLHNVYNENIVWNDKPVLQTDNGMLSDRNLKKFEQLGILFSYNSILFDNNSMLTKKINDTDRFGTSDIYINKNNELVDRHLNDITSRDYRVKNGLNNELFTQIGALRNNIGERISIDDTGRLKAVKGIVMTGALKNGLNVPYDKYGHLITRKGKLERLGDSDVYVTSDRLLSSGKGLALQNNGKDTFQDINRFKIINGIEAYGLKSHDNEIIRDLLKKEVYINAIGQFVYENGELTTQTGLLVEHGGILLGPNGQLLDRQKVKQLITDKAGNKVSYKNMDVYANSEGQLIDENGNPVFATDGQAIYLKDGVLVNSSGDVVDGNILFSGKRNINKGEMFGVREPLLGLDGEPLYINGIEAFVDSNGALVDENGNPIVGDDGEPLYLDADNKITNSLGKVQDVKFANGQGTIVRDVTRGKPIIRTARGNDVLYNGNPVSKIDGFLVDSNGKLILDAGGNPIKMNSKGQFVDRNGNVLTAKGLSVNGESSDLSDGLSTKKILLDENGNPMAFNGRKMMTNEDGSLNYLDGSAVIDDSGNRVYKTGEDFTNSIGALIEFDPDDNSAFKNLEVVTGPDGSVLMHNGKRVYKRADGSLIDDDGNSILSVDGKPLFLNKNNEIVGFDGELADLNDFTLSGHGAKNRGLLTSRVIDSDLPSTLLGIEKISGLDGNPLMFNGKKVYKRADGTLIDEDGNLVTGVNGKPLTMNEKGEVVNANGSKANMDKFTVNGRSAKGISLSAKTLSHIDVPKSIKGEIYEAVLGVDGSPLTYKGQKVFKLKDGSLVDEQGSLILGVDGKPLFINSENKIVDTEGNLTSTTGFTVNGKKVGSGDLMKIESTGLPLIGDTGIRITKDGLLIDKNGKEISHNGRGIRRGKNGQLYYSDGTEVLDENGKKVYMDESGKLHDGQGNKISGVTLLNGDNQLVGGSELVAKKIGSSDLFVNKRNNLVDASNKPFIHKGKPILVSGGKLVTDDNKPVVDIKGNPISITRSGALIDRSRLPAKGAFITDTKGVLIDSKGRYVNSGGKMTALSNGGPYMTESGLLVDKNGKTILINGKQVYIDDQNQLTSHNGRAIRYKGRKLHLDKRGNVLGEQDESLTFEGEIVTLTNDGLTGSGGKLLNNTTPSTSSVSSQSNVENFLDKENLSTEGNTNEAPTISVEDQVIIADKSNENEASNKSVELTSAQILAANARYEARKSFLKSKIIGYKADFTAVATTSKVAIGGGSYVESIQKNRFDNQAKIITDQAFDNEASTDGDEKRKAGTMLYAVNTYKVNTDLNSKLVFNLFGVDRDSKIYKGTAHGQVELVYDYIVVNFTKICPVKGECIAIEGVGVDPGSSEAAIDGDVDKHFWYRFGGLSLAALFQGGAEAVQSSRERTEETELTGKTVSYSGLDTDKLLISSTGVLAETLSGIFTENVSRPYTGIIEKDEEIGIFLLEDMVIKQ